MAFTLPNIEQAVQQFYQNAGVYQQQVHKWLTEAQISKDAWVFCWDLILPEKSVEIQYFGANTLHVKISRYWADIPEEQYETLRSRLLQKIIQFTTGPKIVLTRLCVTLASLILHMVPEHWQNPVETLITTFQNQSLPQVSDAEKCHVLLETLRVLPEEFFSSNLSQAKKSLIRGELNKGIAHVLPLLHGLMSPNSPMDIYERSLKCFSSWMEFGIMPTDGEAVIIQVFQSLSNPQLFDTAVDALVNVFSHPESHRFPYTNHKLLPRILELRQMFQKSSESLDLEVSQGICRIVIAFAENHTKLLLDSMFSQEPDHRSNAMNLIQMVLACNSIGGHYPVDENFSNMSFTFWYLLQDDILDSDTEKCQALLPIFQPIYLSLIEILLIKVQYPSEEEYKTWTDDEKEHFRCYRQDIGDTMMYSYSILREPLLRHLCNVLAGVVENSKTEETQWQLMEGIFFLLASVAESVDLEECLYLPALLNLLRKITFTNVHFISSALYMIGSFSEWINCHPESLSNVMPLILQGLGDPEIATSATMSLKEITRENVTNIQPYIPQILTASQQALESGLLKGRDCSRLMSSVGQVLSVIQFEQIMQYINTILTPHIQQLGELVKQQPTVAVKNGILVKLSMLGSLFASLDTERDYNTEQMEGQKVAAPKPKSDKPKPVLVILQQIGPIIQELVTKWIADAGVVEAVCEMFKHALCTLLDDFSPMSHDVAQMLLQMYQTVPQCSILDLSKQLMIMHADDPKLNDMAKALCAALVEKTLQLYNEGPHNYTDVIEAFMNLMAQGKTAHMRHNVTYRNSMAERYTKFRVYIHSSHGSVGEKESNMDVLSGKGNLNPHGKYLKVQSSGNPWIGHTDSYHLGFRFFTHILKKSKKLMVEGSCNIPGLFHAGVQALQLPENHTIKATCSFMNEFLSCGAEVIVIREVVETNGHLLVDRILRAVGGESPRGVIESISDIYFALTKYYSQNFSKWLNEVIFTEGYPSAHVSRTDKEYFVKFVLRERANKRRTREIVKEFSLKCRGLFGTDYATQTVAGI